MDDLVLPGSQSSIVRLTKTIRQQARGTSDRIMLSGKRTLRTRRSLNAYHLRAHKSELLTSSLPQKNHHLFLV